MEQKQINDQIENIEKPETYETPSIQVIEVEVEQGFAASPTRDNGRPTW